MKFALLAALFLTACGTASHTTSQSDLQERHTTALNPAAITHMNALVASLKDVNSSATRSGQIASRNLINIIPMKQSQRERIISNFSEYMDVSCSETGRCYAEGTGTPTEAIMDISIGLITNPYLGIKNRVAATFYVRNDRTLEICKIGGMYVKKFFVVKKVQGMLMQHNDQAMNLTVNLEDSTPYTCL
jgi:hypothetical protein